MSNHEIELNAYAIFKRARKEHLKIDLPTLTEDALEEKISLEWMNLSDKEKRPYIFMAEENASQFEIGKSSVNNH